MELNVIVRALCGAKQRFKDNGEVYNGFFFQPEFEALGEAIRILAVLNEEKLKEQEQEQP